MTQMPQILKFFQNDSNATSFSHRLFHRLFHHLLKKTLKCQILFTTFMGLSGLAYLCSRCDHILLNKYSRLRLLGQKTLFPVVIALFCSQFSENIESWHESSVPLRKVAEKSWRWQKSRGIPVIYDNLGGISDIYCKVYKSS